MIIETKGNKIVGIRNEEVQADTKLYKVVFQPTENDDVKTIELNTLTSTRMEAGEAQQKDYYYMEITHLPTGKTVFNYTDGKVWEYAEEFEMVILEEEEVKEMEKTIISKYNKEIRIISATGEEVTPFEMEVIEALNENYILDEIEANGEIEVTTNGEYIDLNGYEYLVFNNYEEAENLAIQYAEEIMQDCGLADNLIVEADINGWIDEDWFKDCWTELHENMSYDEDIQYIATEEELEQLEEGIISEEEIRGRYFDSLQASIEGQEIDEYKYQFGEEEFKRVLLDNNLIDIKALAQLCVYIDGVGHYLASYDGEEIMYDDLYIYRVN